MKHIFFILMAIGLLGSCTERRYASRTTFFNTKSHVISRVKLKEQVVNENLNARAEQDQNECSNLGNQMDDFTNGALWNPEGEISKVSIRLSSITSAVPTFVKRFEVEGLNGQKMEKVGNVNSIDRLKPKQAHEDGDMKLHILIMLYFLIGFILLAFLMSLFTGWTAAIAFRKGLIIGLAFCLLYVLMSA